MPEGMICSLWSSAMPGMSEPATSKRFTATVTGWLAPRFVYFEPARSYTQPHTLRAAGCRRLRILPAPLQEVCVKRRSDGQSGWLIRLPSAGSVGIVFPIVFPNRSPQSFFTAGTHVTR
jgi:hypothetical protein